MANVLDVLTGNPVAKAMGKQLGLPQPVTLRRGRALPKGEVALAVLEGSGAASGAARDALKTLGVSPVEAVRDEPSTRTTDAEGRAVPPAYAARIGALVLDASALGTVAELEGVRAVLRPALKSLEASGRVIIVGTDPQLVRSAEGAAVQQALEGITRSVGKELRKGATANLILVSGETTGAALVSTLSFLLEGRSA